jgi:hypothetical protein
LSRQRRSTKEAPMNATSEGSLRAVEACVNETLEWSGRADTQGQTIDAVEKEMEARGRELCRRMMQYYVDQRGTGDVGDAIELEGSGKRLGEKRVEGRGRTLTTVFGPVTVRRTAYAAAGERQVCPVDEGMSLPARTYSYRVQRQIAIQVAQGPYAEGAAALNERMGQGISKRSMECMAGEVAKDFEGFYAERKKASFGKRTSSILVAGVDCKGIPMVKPEKAKGAKRRKKKGEKDQKKKMATVATVYSVAPHERTADDILKEWDGKETARKTERPKPEHKRVWASLTRGKEAVFGDVVSEMIRRDPEHRKAWVCLTDGERKLQQLATEAIREVMPKLAIILDIVHVIERLWQASYAFHAEGSGEAQQWVMHYLRMILDGQAGYAVRGMRQSATKQNLRRAKRKQVETHARYIENNLAYMHYDDYLRRGLPIASGAVEGACKNLVKDRFERSGMRWTESGAEAVLKLRALERSGDLEEYLEFHRACEHKRLYDVRRWRVAGVNSGEKAA